MIHRCNVSHVARLRNLIVIVLGQVAPAFFFTDILERHIRIDKADQSGQFGVFHRFVVKHGHDTGKDGRGHIPDRLRIFCQILRQLVFHPVAGYDKRALRFIGTETVARKRDLRLQIIHRFRLLMHITVGGIEQLRFELQHQCTRLVRCGKVIVLFRRMRFAIRIAIHNIVIIKIRLHTAILRRPYICHIIPICRTCRKRKRVLLSFFYALTESHKFRRGIGQFPFV